jgi:predicted nucleic-acid-binding protein
MNNIIIIGLSTLTVSFAIAYSVTLYRVTKMNQAFKKLFISHESLQDFIAKNNVEFKNDSDIHKENFIKFLSDSRDWAYQYIEDVQKSIDSIVEKTADTVKYHKDFGLLAIEPYATQLNTLVDAIEELKTLLPKEEVK